MTTAPTRGRHKATWVCDVCSKCFWWDEEPGAKWYGSIRAMDDSNWKEIVVVCSAECESKSQPLIDALPKRGKQTKIVGKVTNATNQ